MEEEKYIGVIEDPRSEEEKSHDFTHDGLTTAGVEVKWEEKTIFKGYPIKNQDGSSSCVAQATAKMLGIHELLEGNKYTNLSPKYIYTRRKNYPEGGMYFQDALDIACKYGACLESYLPSDFTGESFMNDKSQETEVCRATAPDYKGKSYVSMKVDMDTIAEVLSQGYGVLLGFRFDYDEWVEKPFINPKSQLKCGHGIVAVDFGVYNGERVIVIDDSWGPHYGKGGQRFITEEFLRARCFYAGYALRLIREVDINTDFHYHWDKTMKFNSKDNSIEDVKALQTALQTRGYFPKNAKIDGLFGPITLKAVRDFQGSYALTKDGIVGPKTLLVLNTQFK